MRIRCERNKLCFRKQVPFPLKKQICLLNCSLKSSVHFGVLLGKSHHKKNKKNYEGPLKTNEMTKEFT